LRRLLFVLGVALGVASQPAAAQWLNYRTPGVPRAKDGKPRLDAAAPRAADGHPDLSGVWMHEKMTVDEMRQIFGPAVEEQLKVDVPGMELGTQHRYAFNILFDFKPDQSPMRPDAGALMAKRSLASTSDGRCGLGGGVLGFPLAGLLSEPIKLVQAPRLTIVIYEAGGNHRQIYSDGRTLPAEFNLPAYYGYSAGQWQGDTFVVETAGFNDKTVLDAANHPHSDRLRVVERFRRRDFGHLDVDMTFDDPKLYNRPFTIHVPHNLMADDDIFETFPENERDCAHIKK
jgi:hypothetical protein